MDFFESVSANPNATFETLKKPTSGGWCKGLKGWLTHTPDARAKISASQKGRRKGIKLSLETRAKISAARQAWVSVNHVSLETRAKMSASQKGKNKGKKRSAETRAKMSANHTRPAAKLLMTPNGLYPSRKAVAKAANVCPETISNWIKKWPEHYYYINKEITK